MGYFAEIYDGIVKRVIVADSQEWCEKHLGGVWVETTIDGSIRKNYAAVGFTYDKGRNAFIHPEPPGALSLDENTLRWVVKEPAEILHKK